MVRDYLKLLVLVLGFTTVPMLLPRQRFRCSQLPRFSIIGITTGIFGCPATRFLKQWRSWQRSVVRTPTHWCGFFFTERDGPKRQIHYYNDARIAAAVGGQSRDMAFTMSGAEGGPRGVSAAFEDDNAHPIAIDVQMGRDARLHTKGADLTNRMGHSGDRMLLVFFREKNAFAETKCLNLNGIGCIML